MCAQNNEVDCFPVPPHSGTIGSRAQALARDCKRATVIDEVQLTLLLAQTPPPYGLPGSYEDKFHETSPWVGPSESPFSVTTALAGCRCRTPHRVGSVITP
jgi:hypothetical protein